MTPHFSKSELECKCGCGSANIEDGALIKLEKFRILLDLPFSPNSAARCVAYNRTVGGGKNSQHIATARHPSTAFDLPLVAPIEVMAAYAGRAGFRSFGFYGTFIHMDNRRVAAYWFG